MSIFSHRLAQMKDLARLRALMTRAIDALQDGFLSPDQVLASHKVMGLDTQLIVDQTYFLIETDGHIAGCGGWSNRATLYGGDESVVTREPALLDPAINAAKIRAMYTDPAFVRRGVGKMILGLCEDAARAAGFVRAEMMATLAGEPLYRAYGYRPMGAVEFAQVDAVQVPLLRMEKRLEAVTP